MADDGADIHLANPAVDRAITGLEAMADAWEIDFDLPQVVQHLVSPMQLNKNTPQAVRDEFTDRMKHQITEVVKQAFIEGAMRGCTGAFDAMRSRRENR